MSWSHSFNGMTCSIAESQHRIALNIKIDEINEMLTNNLIKLTMFNFCHFIIDFNKKSLDTETIFQKLQILNKFKEYYESKSNGCKLIISVHSNLDMMSTVILEFIINNNLQIDVIIYDLPVESKETNLNDLKNMYDKIVENNKVKLLQLGIGNISSEIYLDWILSNIPVGVLNFVHLGLFKLPNIRSRCIELIHSKGLNVYYDINNEVSTVSAVQSAIINEICSKYEITPLTAILKIMLQLGIVITIPYDLMNDSLLNEISRLVHPFVYRKEFVSVVKIISLCISKCDIEKVRNCSDEIEAEIEEKNWVPFVKNITAPRVLRF